MKTVGIIGGLGPESTVVYYRSIITLYREQKQDGSYPSIILNSVDMHKVRDLIERSEYVQVAKYLADEGQRLARAGADFGLLAANTPHLVFDEVQRQCSIPLLSIVQATCDAAKELKLTRLALFGTRFTMQGRFFSDVFSREGVALIAPTPDEQTYIHGKYFDELVEGIVLPETREGLLQIADRMKQREGIDGLILGGTELSLILPDATACGIPVLDTTQIHVKSAVARLLS